MSDLEKRVEHWLEYGKEYRWSNEFMTFLSDVKTAFLAPRVGGAGDSPQAIRNHDRW